jgi:hypothetical protein
MPEILDNEHRQGVGRLLTMPPLHTRPWPKPLTEIEHLYAAEVLQTIIERNQYKKWTPLNGA